MIWVCLPSIHVYFVLLISFQNNATIRKYSVTPANFKMCNIVLLLACLNDECEKHIFWQYIFNHCRGCFDGKLTE
jgi:hypothetical protein